MIGLVIALAVLIAGLPILLLILWLVRRREKAWRTQAARTNVL